MTPSVWGLSGSTVEKDSAVNDEGASKAVDDSASKTSAVNNSDDFWGSSDTKSATNALPVEVASGTMAVPGWSNDTTVSTDGWRETGSVALAPNITKTQTPVSSVPKPSKTPATSKMSWAQIARSVKGC